MQRLVVAIGDVRDEVVPIERDGASARSGRMSRCTGRWGRRFGRGAGYSRKEEGGNEAGEAECSEGPTHTGSMDVWL